MSYTKKQLPLIVIFGRTNVGKSTLFNCLSEKKKALVSNLEGTTRDSNFGLISWQGASIKIVDTGGIIDLKYLIGKKAKTDDIETKVQQQARDYLTRADLILFLVDAKAGLLPQDKYLSLFLKKNLPKTSHIILIANKTDGPRERKEIAEFNKLSLGEPVPVSAVTGSGTGDLLDIVIKKLKTLKNIFLTDRQQMVFDKSINVCILGKPNVGKSSLINTLLDKARSEPGQREKIIVSPLPHTTREPQDTQIFYQNQIINLIDTAGISKRGQKTSRKIKQKTTLEKLSIAKSLKALAKANIALLMIDLGQELTRQDAKLAQEIIKRKVSLIIVANKWDLVQTRDTKKYTEYIYSYLPFVSWAPIQFTSALTGEKINKILELIVIVAEQRKIQIKENALNKFLNNIVKKHRPTKDKGTKRPHISYLKQITVNPPKFSIQIGAKDSLRLSYIKFIENRLREKFDFLGTPITIKIIKKS